MKNSGLVGQNCSCVSGKGLHILRDEDSVLLGLIPERIKALSKGKLLRDSREARPRPRAHGRNHKPPQVVVHPVCPA